MAKYFISIGLLIGISAEEVSGQALPPIQLDRPDQTECPFIVPAKYVQVEMGISYENADADSKNFAYPSALWKYGINDNVELRLITEVASEKNRAFTTKGIRPLTIGFKARLWEEKGMIPKTSFIGHLQSSALGSNKFRTTYVAPAFRFTMQHTLSSNLSLGYNLGAEWNGETPEPTYLYTLTVGKSWTERLGSYAEIYGFVPQGEKAAHLVDLGFTYLLTNDLMADISGGFGLTDNAPHNFIAMGISFRINTSKK